MYTRPKCVNLLNIHEKQFGILFLVFSKNLKISTQLLVYTKATYVCTNHDHTASYICSNIMCNSFGLYTPFQMDVGH